jgi:hypothetical protein
MLLKSHSSKAVINTDIKTVVADPTSPSISHSFMLLPNRDLNSTAIFPLSTETGELTEIFPPMETRCATESVSFPNDNALPSKYSPEVEEPPFHDDPPPNTDALYQRRIGSLTERELPNTKPLNTLAASPETPSLPKTLTCDPKHANDLSTKSALADASSMTVTEASSEPHKARVNQRKTDDSLVDRNS